MPHTNGGGPINPTSFRARFTARRHLAWTASIDPRLLDRSPDELPDLFGTTAISPRRLVVIDETVHALYGDAILSLLSRYGIHHPDPLLIPGGEGTKTRATVTLIHEHMEKWGVRRFGEPVLIWGGGVMHDVAGLAAAEYRRGVPYRFFATTLVAAIDAMYALKVGTSDLYKNRIGAYHPPELAVADPRFLATQAMPQILDGVGEIFKVGITLDRRLFSLLEGHGARAVQNQFQGGDPKALKILHLALSAMTAELSNNPYELNPKRASYGGHNISPRMEPTIPHGAAVVLDLLWSTMIAWRRELISTAYRDRILDLAQKLRLSRWHPVLEDPEPLIRALADTTLHRGSQLVPVPRSRPGRVAFLDDITADDLTRGLSDLHAAVTK